MFLLPSPVPDKPAAFDSVTSRWWSYPELASRIATEARALPREKALAFIFSRNDIGSLSAYLACQETGYATALLQHDLAANLQEQLVATYQPDIVYAERAPTPDYQCIGPNYWHRSKPFTGPALAPELAVLLSTSGSTGSPKFVRLTQQNLLSNADSIITALGITAADRAVAYLPMSYSFGLSVIHTHLRAGASLVLTNESLTSAAFWELVRNTECTSFPGVPYSYQLLQRLDPDKLNIPSIRTMVQAGGKLDERRILWFHERMQQRGGKFFVMYGQTEASARIAVLPPEALPQKAGTVGLPIPGGRFSLEADGNPVTTPGETGELIYEGPNVMLGYAENRSDLAAGDEMQGRLPTGDLASLDAEGYLTIVGRAKRDAKLFGLRVNLDEIEAMMKIHGPTGAVYHNSAVHLFCEYGSDEEFQRWRNEMAAQLRIHHQAFVFHRVEALPVKSSGKIDYQALLSQA